MTVRETIFETFRLWHGASTTREQPDIFTSPGRVKMFVKIGNRHMWHMFQIMPKLKNATLIGIDLWAKLGFYFRYPHSHQLQLSKKSGSWSRSKSSRRIPETTAYANFWIQRLPHQSMGYSPGPEDTLPPSSFFDRRPTAAFFLYASTVRDRACFVFVKRFSIAGYIYRHSIYGLDNS